MLASAARVAHERDRRPTPARREERDAAESRRTAMDHTGEKRFPSEKVKERLLVATVIKAWGIYSSNPSA